jgi:hypothetical protein
MFHFNCVVVLHPPFIHRGRLPGGLDFPSMKIPSFLHHQLYISSRLGLKYPSVRLIDY